jgi:indole-3-glycerol phosphate synthase
MSDILAKICLEKKVHIARQKVKHPLNDLTNKAKYMPAPRGFRAALHQKKIHGQPALIAEIKKASPSKGLIRADFDPPHIARAYKQGGATALSVLTDEPYFQGHDTYVPQVREYVPLPVLRKDFMIDPYQIYESRVLEADCVLLIMAALSDMQAQELYRTAKELGMDILIEVHDQDELERAMSLNPDMVGINNRNLKTLEVTLETSRTLLSGLPDTVMRVAESGIYTHENLIDMKNCGADAFLVGESLMKQDDIELAVKKLLGTN